MVFYEDIKYYIPKDKKQRSWDEWKQYIEDQGGEMLTLKEIREVHKSHNNRAVFPDHNVWVAIYHDSKKTVKDWFYLGG